MFVFLGERVGAWNNKGACINFFYENYAICIAGHKENLYQGNLYSPRFCRFFFNAEPRLPRQSTVLTNLARKELGPCSGLWNREELQGICWTFYLTFHFPFAWSLFSVVLIPTLQSVRFVPSLFPEWLYPLCLWLSVPAGQSCPQIHWRLFTDSSFPQRAIKKMTLAP